VRPIAAGSRSYVMVETMITAKIDFLAGCG
jgi:hypothetical protein